jgi:hypothetical protein
MFRKKLRRQIFQIDVLFRAIFECKSPAVILQIAPVHWHGVIGQAYSRFP